MKAITRSSLRALLSDPPMRGRLTWREGLRPDTLVSEDRGLMARVFGSLFIVGGIVGLIMSSIGEAAAKNALTTVLSALAPALGAVCFIGYRRLPIWFFELLLVVGTLMITAVAASAPDGADAAYGFFYIWVVFLAFLFFSLRLATLQVLFAAAAYASVLLAHETPFTAILLVSGIATFGTTGVIMGLIRARIEGVAGELAGQAHTDPVTMLANRRGFDSRFGAEVQRAVRYRRPLSLVICDLDRFKAVNDRLGHDEGDRALRRAAVAILEATRSADHVARLGGEEFGIVLPETDRVAGYRVAERIRNSIRVEFGGFPVPVTASCGVAALTVGATGEDLFRAADAALYEAKEGGRDRTEARDSAVTLRRVSGIASGFRR